MLSCTQDIICSISSNDVGIPSLSPRLILRVRGRRQGREGGGGGAHELSSNSCKAGLKLERSQGTGVWGGGGGRSN